MERLKQGFGAPVDAWLRGPLRAWAEELLGADALAADDLLDPAPIRRLWQQRLSGRHDHGQVLWRVLMLRAWRREMRLCSRRSCPRSPRAVCCARAAGEPGRRTGPRVSPDNEPQVPPFAGSG
jgi:asparagine synthase (glutamine-hydrolysing)